MRVLVLGAGMYVTGRGGYSNATVLSSVVEAAKSLPIEQVVVAARNETNRKVVGEAAERINGRLGMSLDIAYECVGDDPAQAIDQLGSRYDFTSAIVAVPDSLHFAYTRALLTRKIHALVVKPLTPTLDEARQLLQLQEEQGVWGAVEYHKRFDEANQYAKKVYEQGQLGKIVYVTVDFSQKIIIPTVMFRSWVHTSNPFQYLGTHYVDMIHYITGYRPVAVSAMGTRGVLTGQGIDTFDSVHGSILWANPADDSDRFVSNLNTNWIDPNTTSAMSDQKYMIVGTKGRIVLDQKCRGIQIVNEGEAVRDINPYFSEFVDEFTGHYRFSGYGHRSIYQFFRDLHDLHGGRTSLEYLAAHRSGFRNSLVSVAVVDAANRSLAHGFDWMQIDPGWLALNGVPDQGMVRQEPARSRGDGDA